MIKMKNEKIKELINKSVAYGLCVLMFVVVIIALFTPVVVSGSSSISPFNLIASRLIEDLKFGGYETLVVSYYAYKYFYIVFAVVSVAALFLIIYCFISKNKNFNKYINAVMCVMLTFLFVSMLVGMNYINVYSTIDSKASIITYSLIFFIIGLVLLILKYIAGILFGKKIIEEELKESNLSIAMSFVQTALTLGTLITPIYIFPGTKHRMNGMDILLGKEDVLSFLPMSGAYKAIILTFTIAVTVSLLINILFFIIKRKIFIHYNKFNIFLGLAALIIYALMGLNYMLVYVDAKAYSTFFNTSMNTYSYIPLAFLLFFWAGAAFAKLAAAKLNVEYKIYAKPGDAEEESRDTSEKDNKDKNKEKEKDKDQNDGNAGNGVPDPIPAFSELDKRVPQFKAEYKQRMGHIFTDLTLPKLVNHVIEYAKYSKERLSYGPVEVKTFIAGLAAGRLSILQGMSGTGKTSLPKIFMEAIDGFCELVAVESSWRDKNELLGYYNEFNKKYTPKSFTQFLYKASLNNDVPYFIVLDEMNLSRIEYYFSDFLSLMESREEMRHIKLFDVQLYPHIDERTNYSALRDGHTIDIPPNVWFIGTANRDESTFEISDKVYDRAQTMNFDKRASKVKIAAQSDYPQKFVPYPELRKLFDKTKAAAFDAESYDAIKKVEELLRPYKISFGNRVLNQIEEFVKAYVACSEIVTDADRYRYIHEAVDCIVFSKVVRKLELKQITDIDSLIDGFAGLRLPKCEEFLQTLIETA